MLSLMVTLLLGYGAKTNHGETHRKNQQDATV